MRKITNKLNLCETAFVFKNRPSQDEKGAYFYTEVRASNNRNSLFYTDICKEYFSGNLERGRIFIFTT